MYGNLTYYKILYNNNNNVTCTSSHLLGASYVPGPGLCASHEVFQLIFKKPHEVVLTEAETEAQSNKKYARVT